MIVLAAISEAKIITEVALKSKAFLGYSKQQITDWTEELTVSEKMISEMNV